MVSKRVSELRDVSDRYARYRRGGGVLAGGGCWFGHTALSGRGFRYLGTANQQC